MRKFNIREVVFSALVITVMVTGYFIAVMYPFSLQPPFFKYTRVLYALVAFMWVPVLVIGYKLHPIRNLRLFTALAIFCVPAFLLCLVFLAESLAGLVPDTLNCTQMLSEPDIVRYVCNERIFTDSGIPQLYEGQAGSVFMFRSEPNSASK